MNITFYGLDLAKRVFQVHWVEPDTGELKRKALGRPEVAAFFARRAPGVVAMESCGSAHYWGRVLRGHGHQVRVIAAQFVRPFVKTNKTDAADAEAIWEAAQRPGMRFVALKSEEQQAVLSLHRMRAQLVKIRAMQAFQVRSLLYEFGVVAPKGHRALREKAGPVLADQSRCPVPELTREELLKQLEGAPESDGSHRCARTSDRHLAAPRSGVRATHCDPGRGPADRHCDGGNCCRCTYLSLRAGVCSVPGSGPQAVWHRRSSEVARYQQTR